ncbi:hypothetical protein EYF80_010581 [Liparis tanakae]|uniref:Uncharacterized protein n=1 Tax=Liparis tanakae TaxID=230148 RepID=A0A4Z2IPN1_9TELE|nr:hypothetical protein EYF80_010581 [Liparis tanakae]
MHGDDEPPANRSEDVTSHWADSSDQARESGKRKRKKKKLSVDSRPFSVVHCGKSSHHISAGTFNGYMCR